MNESKYYGNLAQIYDLRDYRLLGGRGNGMRAVDVHSTPNLDFTCVADRCMDLHNVRFMGYNLGYLTPAGDVSPAYYDDKGVMH